MLFKFYIFIFITIILISFSSSYQLVNFKKKILNFLKKSDSKKRSFSSIECITCMISIRVIEQKAIGEEKLVSKVLEEICELFFQPIKSACIMFVDKNGEKIVKFLNEGHKIDSVCHKLGMCNPKCILYQKENNYSKKLNFKQEEVNWENKFIYNFEKIIEKSFLKDFWNDMWWNKVIKVYENNSPIDDNDGDSFSQKDFTFR
jgi:hypothetical protein